MRIVVPTETRPGETRVALVPESIKKLAAAGHTVTIQSGAGVRAGFPDPAYADAGASIVPHAAALLEPADLVLKVNAPSPEEVARYRAGAILLASLMPTRNLDAVRALADRRVSALSTDAIPRTTRAQAMDTLSSMANIAGYRGALLAALELGKYFPMLMTAAGTVLPAKVFVIGAGVAGLQAIATAKRLGATVFATDVRPEVKEQIESVGGKYVGVELAQSAAAGGGYAKELSAEDQARQRELLAEQCAASDAVITTALIGGVIAPRLLPREVVQRMRPGSVVVDLAADGGGNCELSVPGSTVRVEVPGGTVTIAAPLNLPASMPFHASLLWSRNLAAFVLAFTKDGSLAIDTSDDIILGALVTHAGEILHAKAKEALAHAR